MNKRYFIAFYMLSINSTSIVGECQVTTGGKYASRSNIAKVVKNQLTDDVRHNAIVVVTNIIELNESDFNDWNRDETVSG